MARRGNDLFIGTEYLNIEGRSVKHPALIREWGTANIGKIGASPINLYGLDLETNYLTGELKLLGFWNGKAYRYYMRDFLTVLAGEFKWAMSHGRAVACWNRLDPFVIFKQFLYYLTEPERDRAMRHFGKIGGQWDSKKKEWTVLPVCEVELSDGQHFGIMDVIRSSILFYFYRPGFNEPHTVWMYDIAQLYEGGLEYEASYNVGTKDNPTPRLPYYSKGDESLHKIEWDRFDADEDYRLAVLRSNQLDARAVFDLGMMVQTEFKRVFGYYPTNLVSAGSLARASIVATIQNRLAPFYEEPKELRSAVMEEYQSIGIVNYLDVWIDAYGSDTVKDYLSLCCETYSGATIEAYQYGSCDDAWMVDLASAYPAIIRGLFDLRGSTLTHGEGEPPHIPLSYCFIRGTVDIPIDCDYHPITVKSPTNEDTNIHAVGTYRASYTINERDYLVSCGAKFTDETWYNLATTGQLSPIALSVQSLLDLRAELKAKGDSAEYRAKRSANSVYGILYEAIETYLESLATTDEEIEVTNDLDPEKATRSIPKRVETVVRAGYRAGELFQPIYGAMITSETRLALARACRAVKQSGGEPIVVMTDSVIFKGDPSMIPGDMIRVKKTVGFFETPKHLRSFVCLGSGRYSYTDDSGEMTAKLRGLNHAEIHSPDGIVIDDFDWRTALEIAIAQKTTSIRIGVRVLVSVGLVYNSNTWTFHDLGRVVDEFREVDLIAGRSKRIFPSAINDPETLFHSLVKTSPIILSYNSRGEICDQTLPQLRQMMNDRTIESARTHDLKNRKKASQTYRDKVKDETAVKTKTLYAQLRAYGYDRPTARDMSKWSSNRRTQKLLEDKKI